MSENSVLRFARCTLSHDNILRDFVVDDRLLLAAKQPVPVHSFQKEFECIANYHDLKQAREKANQQQQQSEKSLQPSSSQQQAEAAQPTSQTTHQLSSPVNANDSDLSRVEDKGFGGKEANPAAPSLLRQSSLDDKEYAVLSMMEKTGEERDVCFFYLESMGWDLDEAIKLLKSMVVK